MRQPVFQNEDKGFWRKLSAIWKRQPFVLKIVFCWVPIVLLIFTWITLEESLGIQVHHSQHKPIVNGHWGKPTANIDWCEDNYTTTYWIAEFWNTWTSIAVIFAGLVPWMRDFQYFGADSETPFLLTYFVTCLIGVGSFMFHGTLMWSMQMLDEVPMVYAAIAFIYVFETIEDLPGKKKSSQNLKTILISLVIFGTALEVFLPSHPEAFQLNFVGLFLYCVYRALQVYAQTSKRTISAYTKGMASFVFGASIWVMEPFLCNRIGWLQLHSWWHIFSALGTFYFICAAQEHRVYVLRSKN